MTLMNTDNNFKVSAKIRVICVLIYKFISLMIL
jgi:hypothetical protein